MSFVKVNAAPASLHKHVLPTIQPASAVRASSRMRGMRAYQADADLTRFPNGARLSTLRGYEAAPDLTAYTNGRPLPGARIAKSDLLQMALAAHGLRGLGDGTDWSSTTDSGIYIDPTLTDAQTIDQTVSDSIPYQDLPAIDVGAPVSTGGYTVNPVTGQLTPVTATGQPASLANTIANLFNGITRRITGNKTPVAYSASGVPVYTSPGQVLNQPLYSGASITTGSALVYAAAAVAALLVISRLAGGGGGWQGTETRTRTMRRSNK